MRPAAEYSYGVAALWTVFPSIPRGAVHAHHSGGPGPAQPGPARVVPPSPSGLEARRSPAVVRAGEREVWWEGLQPPCWAHTIMGKARSLVGELAESLGGGLAASCVVSKPSLLAARSDGGGLRPPGTFSALSAVSSAPSEGPLQLSPVSAFSMGECAERDRLEMLSVYSQLVLGRVVFSSAHVEYRFPEELANLL